MKKFALLLSVVFAAGLAVADEKKAATKTETKSEAKADANKAVAGKTHEVEAEVVSIDAKAKTVTIKGEKENKTIPVLNEKALASLKVGKATLICQDTEKGDHQGVTGVKEAAAPAKK